MPRRASTNNLPLVPTLSRLGVSGPLPFVGREAELSAIESALDGSVLLVVSGPVGSGKSRLVAELCNRDKVAHLQPVVVRTRPGDRGDAIRARAERELGALPGTLDDVLREKPRLLIIDDVHFLADGPDTLRGLAIGAGAGRVLLVASERLPLRRAQSQRFEMVLEGLDEYAARELWTHLEDRFGAVREGAVDQALIVSGGMPMGLRREFARSLLGQEGSGFEALSATARAIAEVLAVIDLPVAPSGIAALVDEPEIEDGLIELVKAQVIDPLADGRFAMHDEPAQRIIEQLGDRRASLESMAAERIHSDGEHGSGAFGLMDRVDRMRECVAHWLAAGEPEKAAAVVEHGFDDAASRGSAGEVTALARRIESAAPELGARLRRVRARAARRQGHVVSALELGGIGDRVIDAWLRYQAGEVDRAREELATLVSSDNANIAALACARLVRIEVDAGVHDQARRRLAKIFDAGVGELPDSTRAQLHLAMAVVAAADGDATSARTSLARARSVSDIEAELVAVIDLRRLELLALEGRAAEAAELLVSVSSAVAQLDLGVLFDEVRRSRAHLAIRRGDLARASDDLRGLVARHRERGADVPALRVELDLAHAMLLRGELRDASELSHAARRAALALGLDSLAARAVLIRALIDIEVLRVDAARQGLAQCADAPSAAVRAGAADALRLLDAWTGVPLKDAGSTDDDVITERAKAIAIAVAQSDTVGALQLAREQAAGAEGAGRDAEMVKALSVLSRLQLARGDRVGATAAAARAARTALRCGLTAARVDALLVLAALGRDNGELTSAQAYAQDALSLAASAGLPLRRLAASRAMEVISVGDSGGVGQVPEREAAAAAAMSELAVEATAKLLADLGLTATRPFLVVAANASESYVADASPSVLRMEERVLVVDAVREVIVRDGSEIADLRRRSLLKRLLFLFARSPGRVFSKEEIVQTVWEVEYHPLRHDAALFTNIMRIRRLLGKDGADLIRVSDEGYRFCPEKDFLYVEHAPRTTA